VSDVLVALDVPTLGEALALARRVEAHVAGFKVGLELLHAEGPRVLREVVALGRPVFCDAKLHDIPATVARAAARLAACGVRWVSAHALGGPAMLEAAAAGLAGTAGVLAVTVLTSHTGDNLAALGIACPLDEELARLACLAAAAGAEGVVCAPSDLGVVAAAAPGLLRVTPGIRGPGDAADDQARVATAATARSAGAHYLVVGRPITGAPDPAAAARRFGVGFEGTLE